MTQAIKAALLSALVFPGAGYFFLKRYIRGLVVTSATVASLYFLISGLVTQALRITEKIQRGEVQPDIQAITDLVTAQTTGSDVRVITIVSYGLLIVWLFCIVDSYRIGRKNDKEKITGN
jgi:hypothetical protein